jgi:hypothetical protein
MNRDGLNNVKHEGSRHYRNKKKRSLKGRVNELETKRNMISRRAINMERTC